MYVQCSTRTQLTTNDSAAYENMLKQSTHDIKLLLLSHFVVEQTVKCITLHKQLTSMAYSVSYQLALNKVKNRVHPIIISPIESNIQVTSLNICSAYYDLDDMKFCCFRTRKYINCP